MFLALLGFLIQFSFGNGQLWPKGLVHYAINTKDYDVNSQDIIIGTLNDLQNEMCIKFFQTPLKYNSTADLKILYINNPDKRKNCPPENYNFKKNVVDLIIGYKCINRNDITRIIAEMLKASIKNSVVTINSNDLIRKFQALEDDPSRPTLLTAKDRNYINAHYHGECGALTQRPSIDGRRFSGPLHMSTENAMYYKDKMWPLGIVMYGVEKKMRPSPYYSMLKYAMTTIELATCLVFQEVEEDAVLKPKNMLMFSSVGEDMPDLGFKEGLQGLSLVAMTTGAPGHTAHTLNLLLRILGVPMMSNRFDRDNYVVINWKKIEKGKERYLEKTPESAWLSDQEGVRMPYSYDSATHAPANYLCGDCELTTHTVYPIQDHLWQRTMTMGHRSDLAPIDVEILNILYNKQCHNRYMANK